LRIKLEVDEEPELERKERWGGVREQGAWWNTEERCNADSIAGAAAAAAAEIR